MGKKKGTDLEDAVAVLEEIILSEELKGLDKSKIRITPRKWINGHDDDVDVLVEINAEGTHSTKFFIECKDWKKKPVGKGVVRDLSYKINKFKAQKGFIIARKFTNPAIRAAEEEGIELVILDDNSDGLLKVPILQHLEFLDSEYRIYFDDLLCRNQEVYDSIFNSYYKGDTVKNQLDSYMNNNREHLQKDFKNWVKKNYNGPSVYNKEIELMHQKGSFLNPDDKKTYNKLSITIKLKIYFTESTLIYDYSFSEKRKRIMRGEFLNSKGEKILFDLVENDHI